MADLCQWCRVRYVPSTSPRDLTPGIRCRIDQILLAMPLSDMSMRSSDRDLDFLARPNSHDGVELWGSRLYHAILRPSSFGFDVCAYVIAMTLSNCAVPVTLSCVVSLGFTPRIELIARFTPAL